MKKMLATSLSNRIKELREATGLSQQDLAVKAGLGGRRAVAGVARIGAVSFCEVRGD